MSKKSKYQKSNKKPKEDPLSVKNTTDNIQFKKIRTAYLKIYKFCRPIHWTKWMFLWVFAFISIYATFSIAIDVIHTETTTAFNIITNTKDSTTSALFQSQLNERITLLVTAFGFVIAGEVLFFLKVFLINPFIKLKTKIHNWLHMTNQ